KMEKVGLPLLIHGEVNDPNVDIFDRERIFIETELKSIILEFPALKIVLEHITTQEAVDFVKNGPATLAATITPHHLWLNRNDMLAGGIKPHYYCLPILKRSQHQSALIQAAISADPKFFMGTDSAPHPQTQKEACSGCAGIFNAHAAIEMYTQVFEAHGALDKLEGFTSHFGAEFYGLPINRDKIILRKKAWQVPASIAFGDDILIPFLAGETLEWQQVAED
ncbi:MAG: dihydroorotase, partial [Candidatus Berkiellales bacterium]